VQHHHARQPEHQEAETGRGLLGRLREQEGEKCIELDGLRWSERWQGHTGKKQHRGWPAAGRATEATDKGFRLGSERENTRELNHRGGVVDHLKAEPIHTTPAPEVAGSGRGKAEAWPGHGEHGVHVCEEEREKREE
jgi:hypothetical protein